MAEKKKKASNSSMRLDKFLVEMGKGSRSQIKEMAKKGRIQVNGTVIKATDGKIDPEKDVVLLDGQPVSYAHTEYFMLNKPAGTVSATEDGKYPTVISLIDAALRTGTVTFLDDTQKEDMLQVEYPNGFLLDATAILNRPKKIWPKQESRWPRRTMYRTICCRAKLRARAWN